VDKIIGCFEGDDCLWMLAVNEEVRRRERNSRGGGESTINTTVWNISSFYNKFFFFNFCAKLPKGPSYSHEGRLNLTFRRAYPLQSQRFSRSEAITPQVHRRAIRKPLKSSVSLGYVKKDKTLSLVELYLQ
jgi:hypothetical protein